MTSTLLDRIAAAPEEAALLLDIDGTLAPIVLDPATAQVPEATRAQLRRLCGRYRLVACVSGRRQEDAARVLGVEGIRVVGEHGLELAPEAERWTERIQAFADRSGHEAERKRYSLSFHFRSSPAGEAAAAALERIAAEAQAEGLVARWGRKVLEIRPPIAADKGTAVRALVAEAGVRAAAYAGDDDTDLDAFRALAELETACRIAVVSDEAPAALAASADVVVAGPAGLLDLLRAL